MLACFSTTPKHACGCDVSTQAKKFMVTMNAATSIVTTKSPYMVRTSFTVPMLNEALGTWAYNSGIRQGLYAGSRLCSRSRWRSSLHRASRTPAGRSLARCVSRWRTRTSPLSSSAPRYLAHDAIYFWTPGGGQPAAIGKAIAERAIDRITNQNTEPGRIDVR